MDKFPILKAKVCSRFDFGYRIVARLRKELDDDPREEQFREVDGLVAAASYLQTEYIKPGIHVLTDTSSCELP